jgi:ABC-type nitrate/sulfonate/bicarbonate transport system substrate-binding protein
LRGCLGGFPLKFVAVSVRKSEHFLIARPEFKDLRELKGKRLAVSTLFGSDQRAAEEILRAKGFSPGHIKPVALGEAGVRAQALRSGVVETAAVSSPFDLTLSKQTASGSSAGRRISSSHYRHRVWRCQRGSCSRIRSW